MGAVDLLTINQKEDCLLEAAVDCRELTAESETLDEEELLYVNLAHTPRFFYDCY